MQNAAIIKLVPTEMSWPRSWDGDCRFNASVDPSDSRFEIGSAIEIHVGNFVVKGEVTEITDGFIALKGTAKLPVTKD